MSGAASRFRKLPPPRVRPKVREHEPRAAADLFEHFGVASDRVAKVPAAIVTAEPCSRCGWLCRADELDGPCPLCARPPSTSTDFG